MTDRGRTAAMNAAIEVEGVTKRFGGTLGRARVAGLDVQKDARAIQSVIGLAGQYATVDDLLTGRENLELIGLLYHLDKAVYRRRAQDALERLSLTGAGDNQVKTYSGGMRRRLDLAASLIGRPPVLFLDEPTTGLDPGRGTTCGSSSRIWWLRARQCCSRPSTWKKQSIWPRRSLSWTPGASPPREPLTS
jgi:ABC-type nitrate/sulfonate/bicarbonate transport system ATPase subunit